MRWLPAQPAAPYYPGRCGQKTRNAKGKNHVSLSHGRIEHRNRPCHRRSAIVTTGGTAACLASAFLLAAAGIATAAESVSQPADAGFVPLFNGRICRVGTSTWRSTARTTTRQNLIQVHDGVIHMYKDAADGSRAATGGTSTEAEYSDYDLRLEYQWGDKKFRAGDDSRDAGVLYHCFGLDDAIGPWPGGNEFQIQQGDTGDMTSALCPAGDHDRSPRTCRRYRPGQAGPLPRSFGRRRGGQLRQRQPPGVCGQVRAERNRGLEPARVAGGRGTRRCTSSMERWSTAARTSSGWRPTIRPGGIPLTKGRILIQAEAAEVLYRNIEIRQVPAPPPVAQSPSGLSVGAAAAQFHAADDRCKLPAASTPYAHGQEGELRARGHRARAARLGQVCHRRLRCALCHSRDDRPGRRPILGKSCGIEPAHLLVNATHTHHAPSTVRIHGCHAEPEFVRSVEAGIVQAVERGQCPSDRRLPVLCSIWAKNRHRQNSRMLLADGMINWIGSSSSHVSANRSVRSAIARLVVPRS